MRLQLTRDREIPQSCKAGDLIRPLVIFYSNWTGSKTYLIQSAILFLKTWIQMATFITITIAPSDLQHKKIRPSSSYPWRLIRLMNWSAHPKRFQSDHWKITQSLVELGHERRINFWLNSYNDMDRNGV